MMIEDGARPKKNAERSPYLSKRHTASASTSVADLSAEEGVDRLLEARFPLKWESWISQ
jgi:hypothetical protein